MKESILIKKQKILCTILDAFLNFHSLSKYLTSVVKKNFLGVSGKMQKVYHNEKLQNNFVHLSISHVMYDDLILCKH